MIDDGISPEDFAASLRALADAFDGADGLPAPTIRTSVHIGGAGEKGREAFLAARAAFPNATPTLGDYFVELPVGPGVSLAFSKHTLCTSRTEPRDVEVFDIDPELLLPVVSREEQDRRDAADDARMDAQADADQEARDLGYHDAECRAEIEQDAMAEQTAAAKL